MNLLQFLNQVDMIAMNETQENLAALIHDLARTLPENQREKFLKQLCGIREGKTADNEGFFGETQARKELKCKISEIQKKLELVEAGEICLVGNLNEQYDEWYSDDSEEFIFEDPERVLEMIKNICDLVHQCVD